MVSLGSVRVRVSINIKLFALYFIHRYSVHGATGVATLGTHVGVADIRISNDGVNTNLALCL